MANPISSTSTNTEDLNSARSSEAVQTLRGAKAPGTDPKKIDKAAKSFESLLVGHWLEQAQKSFATVPGTDQDEQNDSSRDQFMSIACESLAQGLSRNGGFGLAAMISKRLEAAAEASQKEPSDTPATKEPVANPHGIK
jgi:Rod binding domain-containing protein